MEQWQGFVGGGRSAGGGGGAGSVRPIFQTPPLGGAPVRGAPDGPAEAVGVGGGGAGVPPHVYLKMIATTRWSF